MATSAQVDALAALYAGYFNRAPDPAGLQFWIDQIDNGREFNTIAADFAGSAEAIALYPYLTSPGVASPTTFITSVYQNLFNRAPDAPGLQFWSDVLASGSVSVADMIEAIINGAVDAPAATPPTFDKATLDNKIDVGRDFAADAANTTGFVFDTAAKSAAIDIMDGVTNDPATVVTAKAETDAFLSGVANPGDTFILTTGADVFVGTAGNDTFNALSVNANGKDATTFSAFDDIDGGAGTDTLNIFATGGKALNAGFPVSASVENVEIVNINNSNASGFGNVDASNFIDATQIWQAAHSNDISNLAATTTAGFRKTAVNGVFVTAATGVATAAIALEDIAESSFFDVSGDALTEVTISGTVADTDKNMTVADTDVDITVGKDVQTATLNSSVATDILFVKNAGGSTKALTTVDASGSTGNITYLTAGNKVATIETGSGDDDVIITTATSSTKGAEVAAMVETGDGDDMIEIKTGGNGTTTANAGAGDDTVMLTLDGTGKLSVNLGEGDDTFMVTGGAVSKGDTVDGGAGSDTLQLTAVGAANITSFSNFEVFDVLGLNTTLDVDILASNNTVTEFVSSGALGGASTLTNLGAGVGFRATSNMGAADLTLTQKTAGSLTVTLDADNTKAAQNDDGIDVVATNATSLNAVFDTDSAFEQTVGVKNDQDIDLTGLAATSLSVTSGGTNATNDMNFTSGNNTAAGKGDLLTSVTIDGSQALSLEIAETDFSEVMSINASAMTGALTVSTAELKTESAANAFDGGTLTLGTGDDVVTITTGAQIASIGTGPGEDAATQSGFDILRTGGAVAQAGDLADTGTVAIQNGLLTFSGTGPTTLAQAISQADAAIGGLGDAVVFEYVGNSYVFINDDGGTDTVVELSGTTGLNGLDEVGTTNDLYVF